MDAGFSSTLFPAPFGSWATTERQAPQVKTRPRLVPVVILDMMLFLQDARRAAISVAQHHRLWGGDDGLSIFIPPGLRRLPFHDDGLLSAQEPVEKGVRQFAAASMSRGN